MSKYASWRGEPPRWQRLLKMIQDHDSDECLLWPFKRNGNGYGVLLFENSTWRAQRLAFKFFNGRIFRNLFVLHSCDNPACFNPRHLRQGTQADNMRDTIARGRRPSQSGIPKESNRGSKNGNAKLTEETVQSIKRRYASGEQQNQIARSVGISRITVCLIVNGKLWCHVKP